MQSYLKIAKKLANELDRNLSFKDIAGEFNKNPQEVNNLLYLNEVSFSIEASLKNDRNKLLIEVLVDHNDHNLEEALCNKKRIFIGVTTERVRQIETKALEKLWVILEKGGTRS